MVKVATIEGAGETGERRVLDALSSCRTFDDIETRGILFHGTCEPLAGALHGGGYDGVFWTANQPSIAQAYIPRSGVTSIISAPPDYARDDRLRPSNGHGFVMRWALDRAGVTMDDLDIEWNGHRARSWRIPDGWPTEGDLEDWIVSQGYERTAGGWYEVSTMRDDLGEIMMPADWRMPGHLIIALPDPDFEIRDPAWSEDALGYSSHNRVGDFTRFAMEGYDAFRMSDILQSDHMGNVGHRSIGVLPAGLEKLSWLAIPARRHDGETLDVFQDRETPEFMDFMFSLNAEYKPEARPERVNGIDVSDIPSPD